MDRFKSGDKVVCIEDGERGWPGKKGDVFTVESDSDVTGLCLVGERNRGISRRRFKVFTTILPQAAPTAPTHHEHVVESRFEVRLDQGFGYKPITRAPRSLQEAEAFITRNGSNYAGAGDKFQLDGGADPQFDIVQVEIIHREKRVRSVKRKFIPAKFELVDA